MSQNDEIKRMRALKVYRDLLSYIDEKGWKCNSDEETLSVIIGFIGEDIPIPINFIVVEDVQVLNVVSALPFKVSQEHFLDMCMAITYTNSHLPIGTFVLDMEQGMLLYRNATCFAEGDIGTETFDLLTDFAFAQVDRYNDRLLAIETGSLSLEDYISLD